MFIGNASGGGGANHLLLSLLNRLAPTQSTSATTAADSSTAANPIAANTSTADAGSTGWSGPSKAQLSDQVLQLLTMMQATSGMQQTSGTPAASSATTAQNGLSSLVSAIDTDGDGSISQSELETYIQGKGGTQAQADALFTGLNPNGTTNLTQAQLSQDLQNAPAGRAHGHHHHHHQEQQASAGNVASQLMQAMDSNGDSSISQSEFENFVTSIGGTTSEADSDFSALSGQGSTGITTDQLTSAIAAFQSSTQAPTDAKNSILTLLDNLKTNTTAAANATTAS
jgi:Ca2+-binding EF-hand superfamily protein